MRKGRSPPVRAEASLRSNLLSKVLSFVGASYDDLCGKSGGDKRSHLAAGRRGAAQVRGRTRAVPAAKCPWQMFSSVENQPVGGRVLEQNTARSLSAKDQWPGAVPRQLPSVCGHALRWPP